MGQTTGCPPLRGREELLCGSAKPSGSGKNLSALTSPARTFELLDKISIDVNRVMC